MLHTLSECNKLSSLSAVSAAPSSTPSLKLFSLSLRLLVTIRNSKSSAWKWKSGVSHTPASRDELMRGARQRAEALVENGPRERSVLEILRRLEDAADAILPQFRMPQRLVSRAPSCTNVEAAFKTDEVFPKTLRSPRAISTRASARWRAPRINSSRDAGVWLTPLSTSTPTTSNSES